MVVSGSPRRRQAVRRAAHDAAGESSELLGHRPQAALLLLRDLREVHLRAPEASINWVILGQGAQGIRDEDLRGCEKRDRDSTGKLEKLDRLSPASRAETVRARAGRSRSATTASASRAPTVMRGDLLFYVDRATAGSTT
jgi:hypothetical protein